jgi:hypothetical protein
MKGRSENGPFTAIPHAIQDSENWRRCSATAIKLLLALARQFNGTNNGDLCASLSVLGPRGWNAPETIATALRELRHYGLLMLTRQGGLHMGPNLYALTWHPIHDCGGKLDLPSTPVAAGTWKEPREPFKRPPRKQNDTTPSVSARYASRSSKGRKAA